MKAAFHTLGCKVNQYETETMIEQFRDAGYEIVNDTEKADVYIINTCTVTNLADRKSRQFMRRARRINPDAVLAVTGCYAQIHPEEITAIDGVEIVAGTDRKHSILAMVEEYFARKAVEPGVGIISPSAEMKAGAGSTSGKPETKGGSASSEAEVNVGTYDTLTEYESLGRIGQMGERTRAFVKIQDGCINFCTYCIIPYARGKLRSRTVEDVVCEVRGLVRNGFREIVLTGINTAFYGRDLGLDGVEPLIAELDRIEGDFRIRLSSLEPTVIDAAYVQKLLKYDRLCHHLHLALQSGSDQILKAVNRHYDREDFMEIVSVLRNFDPLYGLSTDIITGFPGETERDFHDSEEIVEKAGFCKVHVFRYSRREGTPAAEMSGQIPGDVKQRRSRALMDCAEKAAGGFFDRCVGDERVVLVERAVKDPITGEDQGIETGTIKTGTGLDVSGSGGNQAVTTNSEEESFVVGYTDNYIKTYIKGDQSLFNEFVRVRLTGRYRDGMRGIIL